MKGGRNTKKHCREETILWRHKDTFMSEGLGRGRGISLFWGSPGERTRVGIPVGSRGLLAVLLLGDTTVQGACW